MYIFSYSHIDENIVASIYNALTMINSISPQNQFWFDRQIKAGSDWHNTIMSNIQSCSALMLFLSRHSTSSKYCKEEWNFALKHNKRVIPIIISRCSVPRELKRLHFLDLSKDIHVAEQKAKGKHETAPLESLSEYTKIAGTITHHL